MASLNDRDYLKVLTDSFLAGYEMTGEDPRDWLKYIRNEEGKAEAPRYVITATQHPVLDGLRQARTVENNPVLNAIPFLKPLTDDNLIERANAGLNIGPQQAIPKQKGEPADPKSVASYKKKLKELPGTTKAGYLLGSLANDITNDATRSIWWLLNASQAIGNLARCCVSPRCSAHQLMEPLLRRSTAED